MQNVILNGGGSRRRRKTKYLKFIENMIQVQNDLTVKTEYLKWYQLVLSCQAPLKCTTTIISLDFLYILK